MFSQFVLPCGLWPSRLKILSCDGWMCAVVCSRIRSEAPKACVWWQALTSILVVPPWLNFCVNIMCQLDSESWRADWSIGWCSIMMHYAYVFMEKFQLQSHCMSRSVSFVGCRHFSCAPCGSEDQWSVSLWYTGSVYERLGSSGEGKCAMEVGPILIHSL